MGIVQWLAEHWAHLAGGFGPVVGGIVGMLGLRKAKELRRKAEAEAEGKIAPKLMDRIERLEKQRDDVTGQFAPMRAELDDCKRMHAESKRGHQECLERAAKNEARQIANDEATVALLGEVERLCAAIDIPREPVDRVAVAKIKLRSLTPRALDAQPATVVLVVDDDAEVLRALLRLVDRAGHVGLGACNATEALSVLAENRVDVVLCDVVMPGRSGTDLEATMRASGMMTPVVFITGQPGHGAPGVLEKPITPADLQHAIGEALRTG